jgi:glycosyltransferase involved in cell wall biosynthesis
MTEPKISIIIPCYNYSHFLPECLENLKSQSHTNWECLIIDNASTDNSKDVIHSFAALDNRIKYLYQPIKGPSAARNIGIKEAKGEYIQFLDADDLLQVNKFKNGISIFNNNPDAAIVYSDMRYFAHGNKNELFYAMQLNKIQDRPWMSYVEGGKNDIMPSILTGNIMVISSPLIKKNVLDEIGYFDETLSFHEDWEYWLRFVFANKCFLFDNDADSKTLIRVHKTSHSSTNLFKMLIGTLRITLKYIPKIDTKFLRNKFLRMQKSSIYSLEKNIYKNKNDFNFLKESLLLLINTMPDKKYINWLMFIENKKFMSFKISITLNYFYNYFKKKLRYV